MRVFCLVAGFVVVGLVSTAAQAEEPDTGRLLGTVTSDAEAPLETLLVSASGPTGTTVATCDAAGRFEFSDLHPGLYLVRAHASGFTTAGRHIVEINSGLSTLHSMRLRQVASLGAGPSPVLAAGAAPGLTGVSGADWFHENAEAEQPDPLDAEPREPADRLSAAPHAHTEKAWRLRRARRSVLKDVSGPLWAAGGGERPRVAERGVLSARPSNDLLGGLALSGQFQLLARTQIDAPAGLWSANQLPGQVAYVDVGAPSGESGWGLRGAVTMGDSGSWVLAGSYLAELTADHVIALDASYSKQRPLQEELDLTAAERSASDTDANREVGSVKADGRWALSRRLSVGYGAALARYGYLEQGRLFSPHAEVVVEPVARTRVRATVARNMSAPGAEEFLPSAAGFWLPPERTFAPLSPLEPLQAQRTRHIELALERDLGSASVISVRRFQQRVANQTVTLFGVEPGAGRSVTDHYYLANARGLDAAGWGRQLQPRAGRTRAGRRGVQRDAVAVGPVARRLAPARGRERVANGDGAVPRRDDLDRNRDPGDRHQRLRPGARQHGVRPGRSHAGRTRAGYPASRFESSRRCRSRRSETATGRCSSTCATCCTSRQSVHRSTMSCWSSIPRSSSWAGWSCTSDPKGLPASGRRGFGAQPRPMDAHPND